MDHIGWSIILGCCFAAWSFLFAVIEIATEGQVGWALAAPTWRKHSALYGAVMNGKELTGYHIGMFFLPLLLLHLPFAVSGAWGTNLWTPDRELELIAAYFLLCAHWDFQWFVLNPNFGVRRFRPGEIWWHQRWLGRIPKDYFGALACTAACGGGAHFLGGSSVWIRLGIVAAILMAALFIAMLAASTFHARYTTMCDRHQITDAWATYLDRSEIGQLHDAMAQLSRTRAEIARLGQLRAQREQLGKRG